MRETPTRRQLLRGVAAGTVAGTAALAGCSSDGGGNGNGGNGGPSPTPTPLTWSEASQRVLSKKQMQYVRTAGISSIDSRSTAKRAFTAVGWRQALSSVDDAAMQSLSQFGQSVAPIEEKLTTAKSLLSDLKGLIEKMKNTSIPLAGSVWNVATTAVTGLSKFDDAVNTMLSQVSGWEQALESVRTALADVTSLARKVEAGESTDYGGLKSRVNEAIGAIDDLATKTGTLQRQFSKYAKLCGEVASVAGKLGPLGDQVQKVFGGAADQFSRAASSLSDFNATLSDHRSTLEQLLNTATSTRSTLMNEAEQLTS